MIIKSLKSSKMSCIVLVNGILCVVCQVSSVLSDFSQSYGLWPARFLCPWDSPDKNTGMGCHSIEPISLISPLLAGGFFTSGATWHF